MTIDRRVAMPPSASATVETIEVQPVDVSAATKAKVDADVMLAVAQSFAVDSNEAFQAANEELKAIKAKINQIEATRKELKAPVLEAGRRIDDTFKPALEILRAAETACKKEMMRWTNEQARIRREQEEAAQKETARAEAARQKAMKKGDDRAVARAEERAAAASAAQMSLPEVPTARGFHTVEKWSAEVVDFAALVKAVAEGVADIGLLLPNEKELNALATAHKTKMLVPGVRPVKTDVPVSRSS